MSINLMTYPWPDPTSRRIKQLEAERDSLLRLKVEREAEIVRLEAERDRYRDKAMQLACDLRSSATGCDVCTSDKHPFTAIDCKYRRNGEYCNVVIEEVDND